MYTIDGGCGQLMRVIEYLVTRLCNVIRKVYSYTSKVQYLGRRAATLWSGQFVSRNLQICGGRNNLCVDWPALLWVKL